MRKWKLGEDVSPSENLLDPVTFAELIMTLRCNCPEITGKSIRAEMKRIMDIRLQDMNYLLDNNIEEIIAAAIKK
jgi:hypothetical protein